MMRIPEHIAVIPDGNRRWAQGNGMEKREGYQRGLDPGLACLKLAKQYGIKELTFYGFTTDNCKRPKNEVEAFSKACVNAVRLVQQEDISLLVVGNTASQMFPKELLPYAKERVSFGQGGTRVNFLVNYGWEWDLSSMHTDTRHRRTILEGLKSHDVSRVDLIVRWGGRSRLSGLLPLQTVYADICTLDSYWPDFQPEQLHEALAWYNQQDVTLGG